MKQARPIGISKMHSYPINSQSSYSYLNGNPIINFQISQTNGMRLLDTKSLRLNFKLKFYQPGANLYVNNDNAYNGAGTVEFCSQVNSRIGNNSIFDTIRLRNDKNEIIEEIRNYSRNLATIYPLTNSVEDYRNKLSCQDGAWANQRTQNLATNSCRSHSMKLRCGLFLNETKLNLQQVGGLKIDIHLNSNSMVFNNTKLDGNTTNNQGYFQLEDVSLSWNYINLDRPLPLSNQPIPYPQYQSFTTIINSSNDSKCLNLNLSSVNSAFQNYILSSHINNWAKDSFKTDKLKNTNGDNKEILEIANMRNGMKYPLKYTVNERKVVANQNFESHLSRIFIDSITPYNRINSALISAYTQQIWNYSTYNNNDKSLLNKGDHNQIYGVGIVYDALRIRMGAEFKNAFFQQRIESQLDGQSPNTSYLFCMSNQQLLTKNAMVRPIQ